MDSTTIDLTALRAAVGQAGLAYAAFEAQKQTLDLTRGKPSAAQLDLSEPLLVALRPGDHHTAAGTDVRNYGPPAAGLPELREIFAPLLGISADRLVARDNASLSLMYQCLAWSFFHAPPGGDAWAGQPVKFVCPVPGYDRHFAVTAELGIDMITVAMTDTGPDLDRVEALVASDPAIKGMWCVPKYSNPTGVTYSDQTVRRLAAMTTAAPDFRLYWDNAYAIHHLTSEPEVLLDLLTECDRAGNPDRAFVFSSTSKVSFAGGGVSFFGSSPANVA